MFEGRDPLWAETEYDGEFVWGDGRRFEGLFRGFCPLRGVLTDGNGRRWRVAYSGEALLTEELVPVTTDEASPLLQLQVARLQMHVLQLPKRGGLGGRRVRSRSRSSTTTT